MAKLIDGKAIAKSIRCEISEEIKEYQAKFPTFRPHLAIIQIGKREDSTVYIQQKKRAAEEIGIEFSIFKKEEDISQNELLSIIDDLNENPSIHGLLVQLPLPNHINKEIVTEKINPKKDVDGFHVDNIGSLVKRNGERTFLPCTPKGILELLNRTGVEIAGKCAVVVGRIVAIGRPEYIKGEWIKPGAIVIDVGTNAIEGVRWVGDVHFPSASQVASYITPVPGGVGPMTVAMLLKNTME
ncbi:96_t:CDS:2, partial [Entrophospora sp. SA101]